MTTTATHHPPSDMSLLLETASFAAQKHELQKRKNSKGTPYINHPLDVARRIASPGSSLYPLPPIYILQAALLHDTVEDTDTTPEEIEKAFGKRVRDIVMECTDDKTKNKAQRKQAQIDNAPHKSDEAKNVKLADKLSNLTDLLTPGHVPAGWPVERIQEYFVWAKRVTDLCKSANPGLGEQLDELYRTGTFEHSGQTYKCHP